jgi:hypothetical protein
VEDGKLIENKNRRVKVCGLSSFHDENLEGKGAQLCGLAMCLNNFREPLNTLMF